MRRLLAPVVLLAAACGSTPTPEPSIPASPPAATTPSPTGLQMSAPAMPPAASAEAPSPAPAPAPAPAAPPEIPKGTAVLHIGDSFALAGFAKALKPKMKALGVRYEVRAETSSFTTTWSGKMELLIANTQPDLVIINLGANEVANIDPPAHAPAVRRIVSAIGGRPCVWVSPPSWRKDTGITNVIRQNSAPCRYFDSDKLVTQPIPRQSDHIHPTDEGGAVWADAFWAWLQDQRAPADDASGTHPSPWRLKPSASGEHDAVTIGR
jgi:hypothetical protein